MITPLTSIDLERSNRQRAGHCCVDQRRWHATRTQLHTRYATPTLRPAWPASALSRTVNSATQRGPNSCCTATRVTRSPTARSPAAPAERTIRASLRSTFPRGNVAVGGVVLKGNADLDSYRPEPRATLAAMNDLKLDSVSSITTGSPVYLKEINDYFKTGMVTLGGLAFVVMAIILLIMFRVRWRLLPLAAVLIGVASGRSPSLAT